MIWVLINGENMIIIKGNANIKCVNIKHLSWPRATHFQTLQGGTALPLCRASLNRHLLAELQELTKMGAVGRLYGF